MGSNMPLPNAAARRWNNAGDGMLPWASALIARHIQYSTDDLAQTQAHLRSVHESITLNVPQRQSFINYREAVVHLGNLTLTIGCINATQGYELGFNSGDEYLITIPLRGKGWAACGDLCIEYGQNDIMIIAPACRVTKHWHGPGEVISLNVPAQRLDRVLRHMGAGHMPIAPFTTIDNRSVRSFLRMIDMLCTDLQDGTGRSPFARAPFAEQLENLLLTLLLEKLTSEPPAVRRAAPATPAIPYYVRRAEEFIAANAHREITTDSIAAAAGVSLRSIQCGFRRYRNSTPMLYLKRVRLERARALLSTPGTRRKIAEIAIATGFSNFSQFSRDYRNLFGESPSATLAAPRRLVK